MGIGCGAAKSLFGSTSLTSLSAPTLKVRSSLMPVAVRTRKSCRPRAQSGAILSFGPDVVVVDLLEAERRDARLVVDDLLGVAQPRAGKCDLQLGPALAADRTNRAEDGVAATAVEIGMSARMKPRARRHRGTSVISKPPNGIGPAQVCRQATRAQASSSLTTLPPLTISMGRLPGAISSLSATIPSW